MAKLDAKRAVVIDALDRAIDILRAVRAAIADDTEEAPQALRAIALLTAAMPVIRDQVDAYLLALAQEPEAN